MKKLIYSFMCLVVSAMLSAQVTNLPTVLNINAEDTKGYHLFGVVPSSLSYDGTNRVYIRTADNQIAIYSNNFTPVRQFNITPNYKGYQQRPATREVTVTVTYGAVYKDYSSISSDPSYLYYYYDEERGESIYVYEIPEGWTNMEIAQKLQETHGYPIYRIESTEEGTVFLQERELYREDGSFNDSYYFLPETYGKQYPMCGYIVRNGYLYWFWQYYRAETDANITYGEWVESGDYETVTYVQDWGLGYINYDTDQLLFDEEEGDGVCLTQTLFNDDAQYEYLYFPFSTYATREYNRPEEPTCHDCYDHSTTYTQEGTVYYQSLFTGFEVKSENGTTLQSISFPNGFVMLGSINAQIIKISNEFYIICTGEMNNNPAMLVYKINRNGGQQSVQQIGAPVRISAFPCPASHNQTITVNLAGDSKSQTELQVVNMKGQMLEHRMVPAGEKQTTINAARLAPGVNLIRALQNGKPVGDTRVIVQ